MKCNVMGHTWVTEDDPKKEFHLLSQYWFSSRPITRLIVELMITIVFILHVLFNSILITVQSLYDNYPQEH